MNVLIVAAFCSLFTLANSAYAQGTAFTYQGRLNDGANPANGSYDLRFIVYDNSAGGNQQGPILTNSATAVNNGLFTVALDFGNQFPGAARWLEIAVRTNGGGGFSTLSPRQALTPAPYAITAENVVSNGLASGAYGNALTLNNAANQFTGAFTGNGAGVTNVNAASLGGLASSNFWQTGGNNVVPGNFLGSTNFQPVELWVNGRRALRLEPTTNDAYHSNIVNVVAGSPANFIQPGTYGSVIAGGGAVNYNTYGGPQSNSVAADLSFVGGGFGNSIQSNGFVSFLGGGNQNSIQANNNTSFLGGGENNSIQTNADHSFLGGGFLNTNGGSFSVVPGGYYNYTGGQYSFAAGHRAKANYQGDFVWADSQLVDFNSTANDQFLIRAQGGVGIGVSSPAGALHVASASSAPELQITQNNTADYSRLRMNVSGQPFWEMDVSPGPTPGLSWWTSSVKMNLDFNGNLTTTGTVSGSSDRNVKENFAPVNPRDVLDKVAALPISRWNYKSDSGVAHLGPMAQDFHAAFAVGVDDKHISMVDADGVALAAIQGLNQKLEEKNAEIERLKAKAAKVDLLEMRLNELERRVQSFAEKR